MTRRDDSDAADVLELYDAEQSRFSGNTPLIGRRGTSGWQQGSATEGFTWRCRNTACRQWVGRGAWKVGRCDHCGERRPPTPPACGSAP